MHSCTEGTCSGELPVSCPSDKDTVACLQAKGSLCCDGCSEHVPSGEVTQAVLLLDHRGLRALTAARGAWQMGLTD